MPGPTTSVCTQLSNSFFVERDHPVVELQFCTALCMLLAWRCCRDDGADIIDQQGQHSLDLLSTGAPEEMQDRTEAACMIDDVGDVQCRSIHRVLLWADGHREKDDGRCAEGC